MNGIKQNKKLYRGIRSFKPLAICLLVLFVLLSCNRAIDYYNIPMYSSSNQINAVIEIPAGTNLKFEYNIESGSFEIDQKEGKDRVIEFLPYIGNYGFIPSTHADLAKGGDGDALDVLIISESMPTGTVLEIIPIAVLKLIDNGELDYKIIAIPSIEEKRIIDIQNYNDFSTSFPEIKAIIELWFLNYNKTDEALIEGWGDEAMALNEIIKNSIK